VPAAAVIRRLQALSGFTGRKVSLGASFRKELTNKFLFVSRSSPMLKPMA